MTKIIVEGAYVLTNDAARSEYAGGHVVIEDNLIIAVGPGPPAMITRGGGSTAPAAWSPRDSSTPTTTSTSG